ncbi:MAG: TetR/AcrR family transcriptional regulator [Pseudomonadota bacterium]
MAADTREQLLDTAEALFAERGFYGVSIAAIADELGLTKQALLHHFGSKEKLYGAVLQRVSEDFERKLSMVSEAESDPLKQLRAYLYALATDVRDEQIRPQLLMRELLDNKRRAEEAGTWYLKPYLERLTDMVRCLPGRDTTSEGAAFALVYQLLGAVTYFAVSQPTLTGIFGSARMTEIRDAFPGQLSNLIDAVLAEPTHSAD